MITLGSDPELFLRDTRTGAVVSAAGLIGGTKDKPLPMEGQPEGYAVQEDNVMVEFNIPAVRSVSRFANAIYSGLSYIDELVRTSLPHHELDRNHCARLLSSYELDSPQAQMFGCSPDYHAHQQGEPCRSVKPEELMVEDSGAWRFAGGHVHIGYEADVPPYIAGAFADLYLGLPSIGLDQQGLRRQLYGSAGRYRPTEYGIEYRVLSNYWIWSREESRNVGSRALLLGQLLQGPESRMKEVYPEIPWPDVQDAINTENVGKAQDLLAYIVTDIGLEGL